MIIVYVIDEKNGISEIELSVGGLVPDGIIWIDMLSPSREEENFINSTLNIDIPTREEMGLIEVMSPFYNDKGLYYMTVTTVNQNQNGYLDSVALTFIFTTNCLVTVRYDSISSLRTLPVLISKNYEISKTQDSLLITIVELITNSIADILEKAGNKLDDLLQIVFEAPAPSRRARSTDYYDEIIAKIGRYGNLVSKNRESLVSINRLIIYYSQIENYKASSKKEHRLRLRNLTREIQSLSEYANFLSQRNSFLLDATLGMLSVEQNTIIKVFTVAAAVFMPPTLIASIYGMNFSYMPELNWIIGYPFAIILIIISAILPYWLFKRKKWL